MAELTGLTINEKLQANNSSTLNRDYSLRMDLIHSQLCISRKIYGRDLEIKQLSNLLKETVEGQKKGLLITGDSGTGKSFLISKLKKSLTEYKGHYLWGKCEKLKQNIPYYALIQAINQLVRNLNTGETCQVENWTRKIQRAVGPNGQILVDLFPELENLIGKQEPISDIPTLEARNRFNLVIKDFLRLFSQEKVPLLIFIDELQWVDQATLNLLEEIFEDNDIKRLFFIGAYRESDNNIILNEKLASFPYEFNKMKLGNLEKQDIKQLLQDTLLTSQERISDLVDFIYSLTKGNPFFTIQVLKTIHDEDLLKFDLRTKRWNWDLFKIKELNISDSIVHLISDQIKKLPNETQIVFKMAACLGEALDLHKLAQVYGKTKKETLEDLSPAVSNGLIKIKGNSSFNNQGYQIEMFDSTLDFLDVTYIFNHEIIREAAYLMLPEEATKRVHLNIGKLLLENISEAEVYDQVYEILNHWNKALDLVSSPEEKYQLARLNLLAGKKAKLAAAYDSALKYLIAGIQLLSQNSWQTEYLLTFDLYLERAECEYLNVNYNQAEQLFEEILALSQRDIDKAQVYILKMVLYTNLGKVQETIELGTEALKLFNVSLKVKPNVRRLINKLLKVVYLGFQKRQDLAKLPTMTTPEKKAVMGILMALTPVAYLKSQIFFIAIVLEIIYNTLKYGNYYVSAYGWGVAGLVVGSGFGNYSTGYNLGKLSLGLTEKLNHGEIKSKNQFTFGWFISHWRFHAKESIKHLKLGVQAGLTNGDTLYAAYCGSSSIVVMYSMGLNLQQLLEEAQNSYQLVKRLKNEYTAQATVIISQMVLALQGKTSSNVSLSNESFNEEVFFKEINEESIKALYYIVKMQLAYLYGHYQRAFTYAEQGKKHLPGAMGTIYTTDYYFYRALILIALYGEKEKLKQVRDKVALKGYLKKLKKWAENCPENHLHKYLIVAAEMARLEGKMQHSLELMEQAVKNAEANGYLQIAALGYELIARELLSQNDMASSQEYLDKANKAYVEWGAHVKSNQLINKFELLYKTDKPIP